MRIPLGDTDSWSSLAVRVPRSEPGEFCIVRCLPGGTWTGTCPDFTYRHRPCKHIRRVQARLAQHSDSGGAEL